MAKIPLHVNGKAHTVDADPDCPLLYVLRGDLELNNPRFGCGLAQCGACTVLVDGHPARSCVLPVSRAANALLDRNPHPSEEEMRAAFAGLVCRCGSHVRIFDAVRRAAGMIRGSGQAKDQDWRRA